MANQIEHAWYSPTWEYDENDYQSLIENHIVISIEQYSSEMHGFLFCPLCHTPLSKSPSEKMHFSNGRSAHFKHLPSFSHIRCAHRSLRAQGLKFDSEEDARRAIDDEQLAVVHEFIKEKPVAIENEADPYDQSQVEDMDGPLANFPISRHRGEHFIVPTRIKTVHGICRRFDHNLERYYVLPGMTNPVQLRSLLRDASKIETTIEIPALYYGVITNINSPFKRPHNVAMIMVSYSGGHADFCIKTTNASAKEHGIDNNSKGRYVMFFGPISTNGVGLCFNNPGWGEYSILPEKYNHLIENL
ncbi:MULTISPECIES: hypothetical protein [Halomonadaceae]|uniref:hypothetical protein n=1 Tax=Halomonadaceae TaxID=28256 RepID=UPI001598F98C|nr:MULTISPECIES: hypothetical protein [Halomonas]QJQ93954.1 hypothetical protein HIO72_00675 [Halomonas sp. PA5]